MATYGTGTGYSGSSFDRWVGEQSINQGADNAINKMQHQFWVAKQTILRRIGKKEDDCVVASDAELDAKLELFLSIQETCSNLHKVVEQYQDRLQVLAQEEYAFGYFLRNHGELDKTRAGKMMSAVGKAMIYSSQQRGNLRAPLTRLHQEVETFCQRAIEDTSVTVNEMEKSRNDYRGALLWMKDVSQVLDPDTFKQLEKFRRVQGHVRGSKAKFDRHKLACLQKVDLLAAARCNMFSHGLIVYQENLAGFWQRTSKAMQTVSEAYKGYQPYEFTYVKELTETSMKLANDHEKKNSPEPQFEFLFESEFHDDNAEDKSDSRDKANGQTKDSSKEGKSKASGKLKGKKKEKPKAINPALSSTTEDLLGLDLPVGKADESDTLLSELASLDFGNYAAKPFALEGLPSDLFSESGLEAIQGSEPQAESFQADFDQVFGDLQKTSGDDSWGSFLPSQLLNNSSLLEKSDLFSFDNPQPTSSSNFPPKQDATDKKLKPNTPVQKDKGKDMSSWYNIFADLDPLANPDALNSNKKENDDRNC